MCTRTSNTIQFCAKLCIVRLSSPAMQLRPRIINIDNVSTFLSSTHCKRDWQVDGTRSTSVSYGLIVTRPAWRSRVWILLLTSRFSVRPSSTSPMTSSTCHQKTSPSLLNRVLLATVCWVTDKSFRNHYSMEYKCT